MVIAFVSVLMASVGYERLWDWPLFGKDTGKCLRSVLSWIGYGTGHMAGGKFNDWRHQTSSSLDPKPRVNLGSSLFHLLVSDIL